MAERPDRHDLPDDLSPAAFDGLGLDSLSEGVHASSGQWAAIVTASERRGAGRRPWVISAAAVLALVLGVGAALVARNGEEGIGVATTSGSATPWAIPPDDATDVYVASSASGARITFELDGRSYVLLQDEADPGLTGMTVLGDGLEAQMRETNGTAVEDQLLGRAVLSCSISYTTVDGTSGARGRSVAQGPTAVSWTAEKSYFLTPLDATDDTTDCGASDPDPSGVVAVARSLRYLDDSGWHRYLAEHPAPAGTGPPVTSVTTTSTQVPPNVDPAARGQIIEAFERMDERDADGFLPYVEGEDAALMARVADAGERTAVTAPTVFTVDDIDFLTPTSASVAFTTVASLPTGPVTTRHVGAAIVVDGRWQVTRATLEALVTQAGA